MPVIRGSAAWPGADSLGAGLALFQAHAAPTSCLPMKPCADNLLVMSLCTCPGQPQAESHLEKGNLQACKCC